MTLTNSVSKQRRTNHDNLVPATNQQTIRQQHLRFCASRATGPTRPNPPIPVQRAHSSPTGIRPSGQPLMTRRAPQQARRQLLLDPSRITTYHEDHDASRHHSERAPSAVCQERRGGPCAYKNILTPANHPHPIVLTPNGQTPPPHAHPAWRLTPATNSIPSNPRRVSSRYRSHCRPGTGPASQKRQAPTGPASQNCQPRTGATVSTMYRNCTQACQRFPPISPQWQRQMVANHGHWWSIRISAGFARHRPLPGNMPGRGPACAAPPA